MSKTDYIKCRKCGKPAHRVYTDEEIEEEAIDNKQLAVTMKRVYQCTDYENCAFVFNVSIMEVMKAYAQLRINEGKSLKDIQKELEEEKEKLK